MAAGRGAGPCAEDLPSELDHLWQYSPEDQDLDDAQGYLRLLQEALLGAYGAMPNEGINSAGQATRRRLHARTPWLDLDMYRRAVAFGLKPLARSFTLSAAELGTLMHNQEFGLPPTPELMPEDLAAK